MFKLSKKADYGLIAVKHLAMHRSENHACSANEIAEEYGISTTLMAKVLHKKPGSHQRVGCDHGNRWPGADYFLRDKSRKLRCVIQVFSTRAFASRERKRNERFEYRHHRPDV